MSVDIVFKYFHIFTPFIVLFIRAGAKLSAPKFLDITDEKSIKKSL